MSDNVVSVDQGQLSKLTRRYDGKIEPTLNNLANILSHSAEWSGVLAWDAFRERIVKRKNPPYRSDSPYWRDVDDLETQMWLERSDAYTYRGQIGITQHAVELVAKQHSFHPVRDWLKSIKWDGMPRLEHWLADIFGAPQNDYTAGIGRKWMISAVERIFKPGCKADYMLVLESEQGWRKTAVTRIMAIEEDWFNDDIGTYGSKESKEALHGRWIIEEGELSSMNRSEVDAVKRFMTAQSDKYRSPWGRRVEDHPRQCVFIGTVNPGANGYLNDPTGARRFWPVAMAHEANFKALGDVIIQLWAEAAAAVCSGETGEPSRDLIDLAKKEQEERRNVDEWENIIHEWLIGKLLVSIWEVADGCLKMRSQDLDKSAQIRLGTCLRHLGWKRVKKRVGTRTPWLWEKVDGIQV